jgi:hypothetical protein
MWSAAMEHAKVFIDVEAVARVVIEVEGYSTPIFRKTLETRRLR